MSRFVSATCQGERCNHTVSSDGDEAEEKCGLPAEHKVEEAIAFDDPNPHRHPFTAYLCHEHFCEIMGIIE